MIILSQKRIILLCTCLAVLLFFIFGLKSVAQANSLEVITYSDFTLGSATDGRVWSVGEIVGGSVMEGFLSFDVKGLRQTSDNAKTQVFSMVDGAQPTLFDNQGYFVHLRARSWTPSLGQPSSPLAELKSRIDCQWIDGQANVLEWNPNHLYNFLFTWTSGYNDRGMTVKITDQGPPPHNDVTISWEITVPMSWAFLAKQQQVIFGSAGLANNPGFPAQAGAQYSNIILQPVTINPYPGYEDFGGYPSCDDPGTPIDIGNREDQPGTDMGDPYDDLNNPYDTCACVSIQGKDTPPCKDEKPRHDKINLAQFPFSLYLDVDLGKFPPVDVVLRPRWGLTDVISELLGVNESSQSQPSLDISFSPPSATTGDLVNAIASPQNFKTLPRNMFFNWCLTRGDTGLTKSYNEIIASGGGKLATVADPKSWQANGCCSMLTRNPADEGDTDTDNDGMGDDWERRYFLGKTINGVVATEDNVLDLVQPDDDYDNDGYQATKFKNQDGEYLTVTPALQDYRYVGTNQGIYYPGADDKLTNIEEYILDTNPTVGDTAGDGYGDEMSYLGIGAMNFEFTIDMDPGPGNYGYLVTVSVLGSNSNKLVSIASRYSSYNISQGENIQISLTSQPEFLSPLSEYSDSSIKLKADLVSGNVQPEDLLFEWSFNGENICESEKFGKFCDIGSYEITIGPETLTSLMDLPGIDSDVTNIIAGKDYIFSVIALDPVTRRSAQASLMVPVVQRVNITTSCGGEYDLDSLPANAGEPIILCLDQDGEDSWEKANFQWSVGGVIDQANSGIGFTNYPFKPTVSAGNDQIVSVQIIESTTGNLIGIGERKYLIAGPQVRLLSPPISPMSSGIGPNAMMSVGQPGETINFVAETNNFPATTILNYNWNVGSESISGENYDEFVFTIPDDALPGTTYNASIQVRGIDSETKQVYDAGYAITLVVSSSEAALGSGNVFSRGMAAVINLIPENIRIALEVVTIGIGIFILIFLVFRVSGGISPTR
jgi:hypothetical protein